MIHFSEEIASNKCQEYRMKLPLTTVTRRSSIGVAGVPDTPLKLVTIKSFKKEQP